MGTSVNPYFFNTGCTNFIDFCKLSWFTKASCSPENKMVDSPAYLINKTKSEAMKPGVLWEMSITY